MLSWKLASHSSVMPPQLTSLSLDGTGAENALGTTGDDESRQALVAQLTVNAAASCTAEQSVVGLATLWYACLPD